MSAIFVRSETAPWAGLATITGGALLAAAALFDAVTGFATVEGVPGSTEWLVGYGLLSVASLLLFVGLAGIAMGVRRSIGTDTFVGLVVGALGFASVSLGTAMNAVYVGAAGDTTVGGGFAFGGLLVVLVASLVTGVALWRHDVARTAAVSLLASVVVFAAGFVVGPAVTEAVGFDLGILLVLLLLAAGWLLFGVAVRSDARATTPDRVAPVA